MRALRIFLLVPPGLDVVDAELRGADRRVFGGFSPLPVVELHLHGLSSAPLRPPPCWGRSCRQRQRRARPSLTKRARHPDCFAASLRYPEPRPVAARSLRGAMPVAVGRRSVRWSLKSRPHRSLGLRRRRRQACKLLALGLQNVRVAPKIVDFCQLLATWATRSRAVLRSLRRRGPTVISFYPFLTCQQQPSKIMGAAEAATQCA